MAAVERFHPIEGLVACLFLMCPMLAQSASFQGLGDLPGLAISSRPIAISADGATVVGRAMELRAWRRSFGMLQMASRGRLTYPAEASAVMRGRFPEAAL